jgi:hypothetical protein
MIEAAIVGRGVHVPLVKAYRAIQQDCPHFDHLRSVGGGLIVATESMEEHADGLARAVRGDGAEEAEERARAFVASFIRPHGIDRPATPATVDALRSLAEQGVSTEAEADDLAEELRSMLLPERPRPGAPKARSRGGMPKHERRRQRRRA